MAAKVRKNDTVRVLTGRDRGKSGRVLQVLPREGRLVIEGINIRKRHQKARRPGQQAGIIEFPAPLNTSNVAVVCPTCGRAKRVGFRFLADGTKVRYCKSCDEVIPAATS